MFYELNQTDQGLQLEVEGAPVALIRERGGCLDLVWQLRGPQDLQQARHTIMGLLHLLVAYDTMGHAGRPQTGPKEHT